MGVSLLLGWGASTTLGAQARIDGRFWLGRQAQVPSNIPTDRPAAEGLGVPRLLAYVGLCGPVAALA